MTLDTPEDRSGTAGEYVLGTLSAAERADVDSRLGSDAALRREVAYWQDRMLGLAARAPAAEPSPGLWARIEARLGTPATARAPSLWERLGFWQALSGLAVAASLVLASLLVLRAPEPAPERYLAVLQTPKDARTGWLVQIEAGGVLKLVPVGAPTEVPAGRSLQFWTKPDGAAGPTSLGLVRAGQPVTVPLDKLPAKPGAADLFEITLEPEAGSPYDRPSGPILYIGRTIRL
ncbi:MAG TPA: anti-sigma factor [Methylibium sp.]|nr:anti-sigma factor [Methylibium sp.]